MRLDIKSRAKSSDEKSHRRKGRSDPTLSGISPTFSGDARYLLGGGDFWGQMSTAGLLCKLQGQHAFSKKKTQVFFFSGVDIRCRIGGGRGAKLFF